MNTISLIESRHGSYRELNRDVGGSDTALRDVTKELRNIVQSQTIGHQ